MVIDETGGAHGLRDYHAILTLEGLVRQKVAGRELYPGIFKKAALYAWQLISNHPFLDGNKRTGILAAGIFLENNGYKIVAKKGELEGLALKIAKEKLDLETVALWLKRHSEK